MDYRDSERPRVKLTKAEKKAKYRKDYAEPIKSRRELLKDILHAPESERERRARTLHRKWLQEDYLSERNVFGMVVDMMKAMPDRTKTAGQSLADWYLEDFDEWLRRSMKEEELRDQFLTDSIRMAALTECSATQKTRIGEIFAVSPEQLQQAIKETADTAIAKCEFQIAAQLAIEHNFVDSYPLEDLVIPLVLTDKLPLASTAIRGNERLFRELVTFLDQLVNLPEREVEVILMQYKEKYKMHGSFSRFANKSVENILGNIISSAIGGFEMDLAECAPRYYASKHGKSLNYVINQRYTEPNACDEVYTQTVADALKNRTPEEREQILFGLFNSGQHEKQVDAICWALAFDLQHHTGSFLPGVIKDFFKEPDEKLEQAQELLKIRKNPRIPKPDEQLYVFEKEEKYPIQIVTNEAKLEELCDILEDLGNDAQPVYVGFDTEWKPTNIPEAGTKIALIQLFFREESWLVDCVALEGKEGYEKCSEGTWIKFAKRLLMSDGFKVIGFDLKNDLDAFMTLPGLRADFKSEDIRNTWCLKKLTENVCNIDMRILNLPKKTFKLADLTDVFLKITLDKSEQCSSWHCRPLRTKSIIYAARDAFVVVEIFKKVLELAKKQCQLAEISKLMEESNVMAPKKEKSQKEMRKVLAMPWIDLYDALRDCGDSSKPLKRPLDMKVIVESHLCGFGLSLRRAGIDVYIPETNNDFFEHLQLMKRLGGDARRTIIRVPSSKTDWLSSENDAYAIPEITTMGQMNQLISFFNLFNIELHPDDVMLRCVQCNSRLLVQIPGPVIHFLHQYNIIHVQNTIRPDMNSFPLQAWWRRMLDLDPRDYGDVEVTMSRPSPDSDWIVATVPTGCLHITRNIIIHNNCPDGVEVRINKVPDNVFKRDDRLFYVCGECGTVGCDGLE